jgi:predicted nuclease of predicted toxin-antitoxin system
VKILLDENFPLALYRRLRERGYDAEHVIVLGQRGMPDSMLRERLAREQLVFLTNDTEFEQLADDCLAQVIISRLPQRLPTSDRVGIWMKGLEAFLQEQPEGKLFDLMPDGKIVPWRIYRLRQ